MHDLPSANIPEHHWPQVLATVIACRYDAGAGRAIAFGIPTRKHFRIEFNYFVDGQLHTGEFTSAKPIPQNTLFPIRYNPGAPHQNARDTSSSLQPSRIPLLVVGIVGSLILSLAWLAILRGCH